MRGRLPADPCAWPDAARTLVIGNSGSGKSWLAGRLAEVLGCRAFDLDEIHWEPGGYGVARDRDLARAAVRDAASHPAWVIEGVYGWLAREAVPRATALVWLDLPVAECIANIGRRGPRRGGDAASLAALTAWAEDYRRRRTSSSFAGHGELFEAFSGVKRRLSSRHGLALFLASVRLP